MELRQLRYFLRVVELGSLSRAAADLGLVPSALSQQISRLESELSTRLLQRLPQGVVPTEAGAAFVREARLSLRHAEQAARAAQQARLVGSVSVGLAPTTAAMLGLPLVQAMRERYPAVRLHLVESLSGHLANLLYARALDLAILFDKRPVEGAAARQMPARQLLEEDLFLIRSPRLPAPGNPGSAGTPSLGTRSLLLRQIGDLPLILPTGGHGLRSLLDAAFARAHRSPTLAMEVDSLPLLMDAVDAGLGATIQPWAAVARYVDADTRFVVQRLRDSGLRRTNQLCSLPEDELSSAALAARLVLADCAASLLTQQRWPGARWLSA